jgi:hypothetical protein
MVHNMELIHMRWTTRYVQVIDERASAVQERYSQDTAAHDSFIIIGAVEHLEQHARRVDVNVLDHEPQRLVRRAEEWAELLLDAALRASRSASSSTSMILASPGGRAVRARITVA